MARFFYAVIVGYLTFMGILAWSASPVAGAIVGPCIVALIYVFDNHPRKGS